MCCAQIEARSLLAAEPAGQATLCLLGLDLDGSLCVGSSIADLLVESVDGAVELLLGLLAVLVDVLFCVGAVCVELGVKLASLVTGVLDLLSMLVIDDREDN